MSGPRVLRRGTRRTPLSARALRTGLIAAAVAAALALVYAADGNGHRPADRGWLR